MGILYLIYNKGIDLYFLLMEIYIIKKELRIFGLELFVVILR